MTITIGELGAEPVGEPQGGVGALHTAKGNLPLRRLAIDADVTGMSFRAVMTQEFHNDHSEPIEATYIFPLPDRAATTSMVFTAADRTVTAQLKERARARREYDEAVKGGKQAAIAESERDDVFTMRVGNILPGETATVTLTFVGPLAVDDNEATLRLPLVVAPRFIPGVPLDGPSVGAGYAPDTDAVPDGSRITPPVLLPGFPNPVDLSVNVTVDPSGLRLRDVSSSLHTVVTEETDEGRFSLRIQPGERVNRDVILRLAYGQHNAIDHSLTVSPDGQDRREGTFALTVLAPNGAPDSKGRDVVVAVDRSGSMAGWKMVAARRSAARIIDTLGERDGFAVRCFDSTVTSPSELGPGLSPATDSNRFAAVEFLANTQARGGTRMREPLMDAAALMEEGADDRERAIVVITDGQVGNEDQILAELGTRLRSSTRVHTIGIDTAVNAGFLHRLALLGRGRSEFVESSARLDAAAARIHRRIALPVVTGVDLTAEGAEIDAITPEPISDLFAGVPLRVWGRYRQTGETPFRLVVTGTDADAEPWRVCLGAQHEADAVVQASWARSRLVDLTDAYNAAGQDKRGTLEEQIVDTSLSYGVMSRFTAFLAVHSATVSDGGPAREVVQPVEIPHGWESVPLAPRSAPTAGAATMMAAPASATSRRGGGRPQTTAGFVMRPAARKPGRRSRSRPLEELREIAETELRYLQHVPVEARARREALSDLAARLRLLVEQQDWDANDNELEPLRRLLEDLSRCDGPTPPRGKDLRTLWRRAVAELETWSSPHGVDPQSREATSSTPFWKRRA